MRNVLKKLSAVFLALSMSLIPAISGMGTVFAKDNEDTEDLYTVTLLKNEHGRVKFVDSEEETKQWKEQETVELEVFPEDGYELEKLMIQVEGTEEKQEDTSGETYFSFVMPATNLEVYATFIPKQTEVKGELLGDDEVYHFAEDTDYSKIARKDYQEIDWTQYGGGGIKNEDTLNFLNAIGIDPETDEAYGSKLAEYYKNAPSFYALPNQIQVGTRLSGLCSITSAVMEGSQSYFTLGNFSGQLEGAIMDGRGWCADHTAAEPQAGHQIIAADATVTSIDTVNGRVYCDLLVTPHGVTDGVTSNGNGLIGYQHIAARIYIPAQFNGKVELTKSSENTVITNGNTCYSLAGAQYGVYSNPECSNHVGTLTTNANGTTNTLELKAGNYWVKEIQAPKGYLKDSKVYPVTITSGQTAKVQVSDKPMNDPAAIEIKKIDKDTGKPVTQGASSLAGAQFTVKHYGGYYTLNEIKAGKPAQDGVNVRTWVLETKEIAFPDGTNKYACSLHPNYLVAGSDALYTDLGNPILPLGTLTVQETKAPNGYLLDGAILEAEGGKGQFVDGVYVSQIKSNNDGAFLDGGNVYKVSDRVVKGGVKIQKYDAETNTVNPQGDGTLSGAKFDIINASNGPVVVDGKTYQNGETVKTLTTDNSGFATASSDALPYGSYVIREKQAPTGYLNQGTVERRFDIRENGVIVDMTSAGNGILNSVIRGGVKIQKRDNQSGDSTPQGNANIGHAKFNIINASAKPVKVEGNMYQNGQVVKTLTANDNGYVETASDLLPYGTYKIKEIAPPDGYLNQGIIERTFSIRNHGIIVDMTSKDNGVMNDVIRGGVRIQKFDAETQGITSQGDATLKGAEFEILNKSRKHVIVEGKSYQPNEVVKTIVTGDTGVAETNADTLPYGDYQIREKKAPTGYLNEGTLKRNFTIAQNGVIVDMTPIDKGIINDIIRGGVKVQKRDADRLSPRPQGSASLARTEFDIINVSPHAVQVEGKMYQPNEVVKHMVTDGWGRIETTNDLLPYGTYKIQETKAPEGYLPSGTLERTFSIREHHKIVDMTDTEHSLLNDVIRGGVRIQKYDKETQHKTPQGDGSMKKATFEIVTKNDNPVNVEGKGYKKGDVVKVIQTNEKGIAETSNRLLPYGTYEIREITPPEGYLNEGITKRQFTVQKDGHIIDLTSLQEGIFDNVIRGGVEIQKLDNESGSKNPQGNGTFAKAKFEIVNRSKEPVYVEETLYQPGDVVKTLVTDKNGYAKTENNLLPYGTYAIREAEPPTGYLNSGVIERTFTIREHGKMISMIDDAHGIRNDVIRGGVIIKKYDKDTQHVQGDATFEGAVFEIINKSTHPVRVDGKVYQKDVVVKTITTNKEGIASTKADTLPFGTYLIQEKTAPNGYLHTGTLNRTFSITQHGQLVDMTEVNHSILNDVIRGGVKVQKRDLQSGNTKPEGAANFANVEFDIINESKAPVKVEGKVYQPKEVVKHLVSNKAGYVETAKDLLPYGTYTIKEVKAPEGYVLDGVLERTFQIRKDKEIVDLTGKDQAILDRVVRGDFEFVKMDKEKNEPMANIPFKITSKTTGESHVVMTDENGYFSSSSDYVKHSYKTNAGKPKCGLWFGLNADGKNVKVDDSLGALPYDTYTYEELRCKENMHKKLVEGTFSITEDKTVLNIKDILNADITISTNAIDEESKSQVARVTDKVTIKDTITFDGIDKGETYTIQGTLINKETKEPIADPVITTFVPESKKGTVDVFFTFDASTLAGQKVVVFEEITRDGIFVAKHTDLLDVDQTISFPDIKTKALDKETDTNVSKADKEITIVDTVSYKNLNVGDEYTVKGILMDKETKEPVLDNNGNEVTAKTTFTAKEPTGTIEVTFVFDGSNLKGHTFVVFEDLYHNDKLYVSHADIEDEAQTVTVPKVTTAALDKESESQNSYADGKITIVDTVSYENLIPGQSYTIKGVVMDRETGKEVIAKEVLFDAPTYPENATLISLPSGTYAYISTGNEEIPCGLYSKTEVGYQGVDSKVVLEQIPEDLLTWEKEFSTSLEGYKTPEGDFHLLEEPTESYAEEESKVAAEKVFVPEKPNGTVNVEFHFDGRKFAGHTFVVFEELLMNEKSVAEHKDLKDEHQTIYVPEIHTTAMDKETGTQSALADKEVTIVDTVTYKNLIPGKEYKVSGKLFDKGTGKSLLVNEKEVVSETKFTPKESNGTVEVIFKFDGSKLQGKKIVVFENLFLNEKQVAIHEDIEDKGQTITFPSLHTTAMDKDDKDKNVYADKDVTIIDEVFYQNLTPGETYKVIGTLMEKETGKALLINGKPVTSEVEFKAEEAKDTVTVEFTFDGSALGGKDLVVFEKMFNAKGQEIGNHEDINDDGQTVKMVNPPKPPVTKTGDSPTMFILLGVGVILIGTGAFLFFKKKKK